LQGSSINFFSSADFSLWVSARFLSLPRKKSEVLRAKVFSSAGFSLWISARILSLPRKKSEVLREVDLLRGE
jgi:hypothetical protein